MWHYHHSPLSILMSPNYYYDLFRTLFEQKGSAVRISVAVRIIVTVQVKFTCEHIELINC